MKDKIEINIKGLPKMYLSKKDWELENRKDELNKMRK